MKLAASMILRNEADRYLRMSIQHLLVFCDEVAVVDDASDDGTSEILQEFGGPVRVMRNREPEFYAHEGRARQRLLDHTLAGSPTHVLSIDADEFITDGPRLRELLGSSHMQAARLCMEEVWRIRPDGYDTRVDGNWHSYRGVFAWPVPSSARNLKMPERQLASGRIPTRAGKRGVFDSGMSILHLGWANKSQREARHARYVKHDGGQFHASAHLDSILDAAKTRTVGCPVPDGLRDMWVGLCKQANREVKP